MFGWGGPIRIIGAVVLCLLLRHTNGKQARQNRSHRETATRTTKTSESLTQRLNRRVTQSSCFVRRKERGLALTCHGFLLHFRLKSGPLRRLPMKKARLTEEQIIRILQEHEASAKCIDRPPPVMGASTGFHRHNAMRLRCHELQQLRARQFASENHRPVRGGVIRLRRVLGHIEADDANLSQGHSSSSRCFKIRCHGTVMPPVSAHLIGRDSRRDAKDFAPSCFHSASTGVGNAKAARVGGA